MATIIPVTPAPIIRPFSASNENINASECESVIETIAVESNVPPPCLLHMFLVRRKQFRVFFNAGKLIWERYETKKGRITVPIENIIAVNPQYTGVVNPALVADIKATDAQSSSEAATKPLSDVKQFTVIYAKRIESASNSNKWRHFSITFQNNDSQVCQLWIETLQQLIDGEHNDFLFLFLLFLKIENPLKISFIEVKPRNKCYYISNNSMKNI